jgi:hypothetical protein
MKIKKTKKLSVKLLFVLAGAETAGLMMLHILHDIRKESVNDQE